MARIVVIGDLMTDTVAHATLPLARGSDTPAKVTTHGGGSGANVAAWPLQPRNDSRTCRSGLSTFTSTSAMDCHVPSASLPPSTGTLAYGATNAGSTWERP